MALTATSVAKKTKTGLYGDGGNLFLKVSPSGTKSWVFRYSILAADKGQDRRRRHAIGLGPYPDVSLLEARELAFDQRRRRRAGVDPATAKREAKAARSIAEAKVMTFKQCAEAYIAAHSAGWRNAKHAAQWPATLGTYVFPIFGTLPVQAVDVGLVLKAVEPLWTAKPETAVRVRGRIESVLDWAAARGYRHGENPARWRGHLENLLPKRSKVRAVEHHAALPYAEIAQFLAELRTQEGVAAKALEFAILTAARTGEVIGARWDEINLAERVWILPAARMKGGKEHRVPLSDAALSIVEAVATIRSGEFVFPGGKAHRPLSNMAFLMLLRRMGHGDLTAHGFRSSFRDWAAERTNFPAEVAEMALAHVVGDKVEAAYRRGDLFNKRRQLAEAWAKFCAQQPATAGAVVPFLGLRA